MPSGLYGKLPVKRDFVAVRAPRRFLELFEPWLQGSMAGSRHQMGASWQAAYLAMPIWRFWIGSAHAGTTAMGAFMPSVDGVGRYFPLAVFAVAEPGTAYLPPELETADRWFEAVEGLLLSALDPALVYDAFAAAVAALPEPPTELLAARPENLTRLNGGIVAVVDPAPPLSAAFAAARVENHAAAFAGQCCFWTVGGEDFPPVVLSGPALPQPTAFGLFLTGRRAIAPAMEAVR